MLEALRDTALVKRLEGRFQDLRTVWPGILVSATIAMAAMFVTDNYGGPVMLFALLLGMAFNFLSDGRRSAVGIAFTSRTVLRVGVALLGARITIEEVLALGTGPLILTVTGVTLTIGFGIVLARRIGLGRDFGILTGGAVGICGASAALAIASVLPRGENGVSGRATIFTVLSVTTLSTIAMVVYPIFIRALGFDDQRAGIFLGATIHDVAQVVGAGYSLSTAAGDAATITKLLRVALLVPVVLAISVLLFSRRAGGGRPPPLPMFLIVFVVLVAVNSAGLIPDAAREMMVTVSRGALITAIAALGIKTSLKDLVSVGPKALVVIVAETVWIGALALGILSLMG